MTYRLSENIAVCNIYTSFKYPFGTACKWCYINMSQNGILEVPMASFWRHFFIERMLMILMIPSIALCHVSCAGKSYMADMLSLDWSVPLTELCKLSMEDWKLHPVTEMAGLLPSRLLRPLVRLSLGNPHDLADLLYWWIQRKCWPTNWPDVALTEPLRLWDWDTPALT